MKLLTNKLAGSINRLLLPVDYYCQYILSQLPALHIYTYNFDFFCLCFGAYSFVLAHLSETS